MRTIKKYLAKFALGFTLGVSIIAASHVASAATTFTYQTFQKLIGGNNVVPISTVYSYATQLQPPATSVASTTGSLTGGKLVLQVVADTPFGTSSPSLEISTTTSINEALQVTWPAVPGATGYALYFGTSTPGSEQAYFIATSTAGAVNTFYTLAATTSPTYDIRPKVNTGFYSQIGSGTSTISTQGNIMTQAAATTTSCTTALNGSIFYNTANSHLWLCKGAGPSWTVII